MALSKTQIEEIVKLAASRVKQRTRQNAEVHREIEDPGEEEVSVGLHGILAASEKLLAVNRGLVPPDERDSLQFKQVMTTAALMRERVRLDADKTRLNTLRQAAKFRSLKRVHPFLFDSYTDGHLLGNPLSSPLEEINPISLLESSRRVTQMGPGGLGSTDAITDEARMIHPSQFGFISGIEGPECHTADTEVFTKSGWKFWPAVQPQDELACRVDNRQEFHKPSKLIQEFYEGDMFGIKDCHINCLVTPGHRMWTAPAIHTDWRWSLAGSSLKIDRYYLGECDNILVYAKSHFSELYSGMVYCATVPGGMLLTRRGRGAFWSGNSEKIGIDTRVAVGTKIGSDGRLYQKMNDRASGRMKWVSPVDLAGKVMSLPD